MLSVILRLKSRINEKVNSPRVNCLFCGTSASAFAGQSRHCELAIFHRNTLDQEIRQYSGCLSVWQHSADSLFIGFIHHCNLAQAHFAARSLLGQNMSHILASAFVFAATGKFKTLGGGPSGLYLWHYYSLICGKRIYFLGTSSICSVLPSALGSCSIFAISAKSCTIRSRIAIPRSL